MSIKREVKETNGIYFFTFTNLCWLHLFEITNSYDAVYKWFDYLNMKGHFITGYVIMPNHLHGLVGFSNTSKSINRIIGDGKRFLAYEIVERLHARKEYHILQQLSDAVRPSDRMRGKLHEVFEDSFDIKECYTEKFTLQKLAYIHNNPCKGKWNLASCPEEYVHSSAKFYATGQQGIYPVTNVSTLKDIDLTRAFDYSAESPSGDSAAT